MRPKAKNRRSEVHHFFHLKRVVKIIEGVNSSEALYIQWQTQLYGKHIMTEEKSKKFVLFLNSVLTDIDFILDSTPAYNAIEFNDYSNLTKKVIDFCSRWEINKMALFSFKTGFYVKIIDVLRNKSSLTEEKYGYLIRAIIELRLHIVSKKANIRAYTYMYAGKNKTSKVNNPEYWKEYYDKNKNSIMKRTQKYYSDNKEAILDKAMKRYLNKKNKK